MAQFKYVRGRVGFAIFDMGQTHKDIAKAMHAEPESAGFCTIAVGYKESADREEGDEKTFVSVHCYGESVSLGLKSREEDGLYLENQISKY